MIQEWRMVKPYKGASTRLPPEKWIVNPRTALKDCVIETRFVTEWSEETDLLLKLRPPEKKTP